MNRQLKWEPILYVIAFALALGIRLANLGASFLNDAEAAWALQALHLSQGLHPAIGPQPGLVLFTGSLFFVFGSNDFLARLVPALIGAVVALAPLLFRRQLGKIAALILAFGLAFDPALIGMSRQVDGHILAVTFTLLGLGFLNLRKPAGAGIFLGLALLGGPSVWLGWLGLLITGGIFLLTRRKSNPQAAGDAETPAVLPPVNGRATLLWFTGTLVFGGTLFFLEPRGLSGLANSLAAFWQGAITPGPQPVSLLLAALVLYELFPLVIAVIAVLWAVLQKRSPDRLLGLAWLVMLVLVVVYPSRSTGDLVWVSLPMWALAARYLGSAFADLAPKKLIFSEAALAAVLLVCAYLNLVAGLSLQVSDPTAHWIAIVFLLFFLGVALILLTWGWTFKVALAGMGLGACVLLGLFTISAAWRAGGQEMRPDQELWLTAPSFREANLLAKTAGDFSEWNTGSRTGLDVTIQSQSPSLAWLFRNFSSVQYVNSLQTDSSPSMVVTGDQQSLSLSAKYTGQSFTFQQGVSWAELTPGDWVKWVVFRQAPVTKTYVVLWIKSSLFPGSADFK